MARVILPLVQILTGAALVGLASGSLSVLIGVRLAASGAPGVVIGLVLACHFAGFILGCRLCPQAIAGLGHVRAFGIFAAGATCLTLALSLFQSLPAWALIRVGTGFCLAGLFTVVESWLNEQAVPAFRARIFAVYMIVGSGAAGLAPLSLNLVDPFRYELFAAIAIAFALAPLSVALTTASMPAAGGRSGLGLLTLFAASPGGLLACFGHGLANGALYQVSPVYFAQLGFDHAQLSVFLSAAIVGGVVMQMPVGVLADRFGRHRLLLGLTLLATILTLPLALASAPSFGFVLGLGIATAALLHPFYSLGVAIANDRLARGEYVGAAGGLLLVWAAGAGLGPIAATGLMDWIGPSGLYVHIGATTLMLAAIVLHRMLARAAARPADDGVSGAGRLATPPSSQG
ncbi:MAG: MFS transporter [Pseudomonadota bacterium]